MLEHSAGVENSKTHDVYTHTHAHTCIHCYVFAFLLSNSERQMLKSFVYEESFVARLPRDIRQWERFRSRLSFSPFLRVLMEQDMNI